MFVIPEIGYTKYCASRSSHTFDIFFTKRPPFSFIYMISLKADCHLAVVKTCFALPFIILLTSFSLASADSIQICHAIHRGRVVITVRRWSVITRILRKQQPSLVSRGRVVLLHVTDLDGRNKNRELKYYPAFGCLENVWNGIWK